MRKLLSFLVLGVLAGGAACSSSPAATAPVDAAPGDAAPVDAAPGDTAPADTAPGADTAPAASRTVMVLDNAHIGSDSKLPDFHIASGPLDLGAAPFQKVVLTVDLTSPCYPFDKWQTDRPPAGQNFPADCDAFDRNFEVTLDDPVAPATTPPAIELVRAITPFGGPLHLQVDITDIANGLPGMHTLRVMIPSYSDGAGQITGSNGGWNVSASAQITAGPAPRKVLAVVPLFNGVQDSPTAVPATMFTAPPGTTTGRIEYRATGHGGGAVDTGCIGPAEEFCHRMHTFFVDEQNAGDLDPWRTDCATLCTPAQQGTLMYCKENPTGNMASVRAPRANWCPGSVTPPFVVEGAALGAPGDHTFRFAVSRVATGGLWRISAVYLAFGG